MTFIEFVYNYLTVKISPVWNNETYWDFLPYEQQKTSLNRWRFTVDIWTICIDKFPEKM